MSLVPNAPPELSASNLPSDVDGEAILRRLPGLVCLIDADATIRWANRDHLVGRAFTDFLASDDRARLLAGLRQPGRTAGQIETRVASAYSYERMPDSDLFLIVEHRRADQESRGLDRPLAATLQELAAALNTTLRLDEVLRLIITQLQRVLPYHSASLLLIDGGKLRHHTVQGYPDSDFVRENRDYAELATFREIITTRRPLLIGDTRGDPRWTSIPGLDYIRCWLGVPLLVPRRDRLVGVLSLDHVQPHAYTEDDVRVAEAFAAQVSAAIDNARLHEETQRRADHMAALNEVAAIVSQSLDLEQTLHIALDKALDIVGVEAGAISLIDEAAGELVIRAHRGWRHSEIAQGLRVKLGEGFSGRAVATGEVVVTGDVRGDPRLAVPRFGEEGVQAMALAPMRARGRVVGIFSVMHYTPYQFSAESIEFLKSLADQIGVAIDNARLYEIEYTRRRTSEALREISGALGSTLDLDQAFSVTMQHLPEVMQFDRACIVLIEDGQARVHAAHGYDAVASILRSIYPIRPDSPLARLVREKRPLIVSGAQAQAGLDAIGIQSWMGAPLSARQEVIGALLVESRRARAYTDEHAATLFTLSNHLASAVENARLYQETRRRVYELNALHEMAMAGTSTLDFNEVSQRTIDALQRTLGFDYLGLFLLDAAGKALELYAISAREEDAARHTRIEIGRGFVGAAAATGQPINSPDVLNDERYLPALPGTRSEIAMPLKVGERVIGVIDAQSVQLNAFSLDDERLLLTIARQLAVILDKARLYQETQQRLVEMSTLQTFADKISTSLDLSEVLDSIVITLKDVLKCRGVSIALIVPDTQTLEIRAAAGIQARWVREAKLKLGEGISGQVAAIAQPMYVADTHVMPGFIFFDPIVRSLLCVPLTVKDRVIGTLTVDQSVADAFTRDDERVLSIAAAQAAVAIENAQLYEELKERARKLEQAYRELQEADRLKDELVQNVSHELRTPLTFVKGYVELLLEEDMGPINERQRESLLIVAEKTNSVTRLVSDIIFLEQIERESLQLSRVQMVDLARLALQGGEVTAAAAGIHLELDVEPELPIILADRDRINQVFDNLLANAIKFSPTGGTITIRLKRQAEAVLASVSDTGIGIPKDQLTRVFERFYQVDGSATRRFGGAGVGLAIVKRIVEAHGGRVWVESDGLPGSGSTFYFGLPERPPGAGKTK